MQDFTRQVAIAIRWLPLILILVIAAGGVTYAYTSSRPVVVEASGTLRVDPGLVPSVTDRAEAVLAAVGYAAEMEGPIFAREIIRKLGLQEQPLDLLRQVSVDADPESELGLIQIGVQSTDPLKAQTVAKAFGDEIISRKSDQLVTSDVEDATRQVNRMEVDRAGLRSSLRQLQRKSNQTPQDRSDIATLTGAIAGITLDIENLRPFTRPYVRNLPEWVVQPRIPSESVAAGPVYWTLLAIIVAAMAGLGLAFVVEYMRRLNKVRDERDVELATGVPAVGTVVVGRSDAQRLAMLHYPRSEEAESYRGVIAKMGFTGGTARTLVIASASPSDNKNLVAANVALAYAEAGRNVILVDADYRKPRMHSLFGVDNHRGLTTILTDSSVPLGWATVPTPHPRLGLMPSGPLPRETSEPLGSRQLNALLRRLLQAADLVVFNSPAMAGSLDAAVLAEHLDGVLLVIPQDSKADEVENATRSLELAEADFLGAVLYRKARRSQKGARSKVVPAPKGWGPTWPGLYDAPAQIPAATASPSAGRAKVARHHRATTTAAVAGQSAAPVLPSPPAGNGHSPASRAPSGPYSVPFQPTRPTREAPSHASQTADAPAPAIDRTAHETTDPAGRHLRAVGPGVPRSTWVNAPQETSANSPDVRITSDPVVGAPRPDGVIALGGSGPSEHVTG